MNIFKDGVPDTPQRDRRGKIVFADHTGDTAIATFEPGVENEAVTVAQDALTTWLEDCIARHGQHPPVFAKRIGDESYTPFRVGTDHIVQVETILIQDPLVGG